MYQISAARPSLHKNTMHLTFTLIFNREIHEVIKSINISNLFTRTNSSIIVIRACQITGRNCLKAIIIIITSEVLNVIVHKV